MRSTESTTSTTVSAVERNSVKLPRLEIKKFSGEPTDFQSFYDSFQAAVHQNESLKDIEKFTYLRSLLGGGASRAIEGLAISDGNYNKAVKILEERYGK